METRIEFSPTSAMTASDREELRALSVAVYPPDQWADWPGRLIEWSDAEWGVRIFDEHDALASYTGVVVRDAAVDGRPVRIGGVGGIKTRPDARGRGYARLGVEKALEFFGSAGVDFALLVCEPELVSYYAATGWVEFRGRVLVRQRGVVEEFTFNRVMTHDVHAAAPLGGEIDLRGGPW